MVTARPPRIQGRHLLVARRAARPLWTRRPLGPGGPNHRFVRKAPLCQPEGAEESGDHAYRLCLGHPRQRAAGFLLSAPRTLGRPSLDFSFCGPRQHSFHCAHCAQSWNCLKGRAAALPDGKKALAQSRGRPCGRRARVLYHPP